MNLDEIIGINDKRFNSSPSQIVNHELEEVAITTPKIKDSPNTVRLGLEFKIKKNTWVDKPTSPA